MFFLQGMRRRIYKDERRLFAWLKLTRCAPFRRYFSTCRISYMYSSFKLSAIPLFIVCAFFWQIKRAKFEFDFSRCFCFWLCLPVVFEVFEEFFTVLLFDFFLNWSSNNRDNKEIVFLSFESIFFSTPSCWYLLESRKYNKASRIVFSIFRFRITIFF